MDEYGAAQPKSSSVLKIVLWIVAIGVIFFVLLCGGVIFLAYRMVASGRDPTVVRQVTRTITDIELPERYTPSMSFQLLGAKMVFYGQGNSSGRFLMIMQFSSGVQTNPDEMKQQMEQNRQQQAGGPRGIHVEETETRPYSIRGQESQVMITKGVTDDGKKIVQVTAPFIAKDGSVAMLMLLESEEEWDESEFEQILASMH